MRRDFFFLLTNSMIEATSPSLSSASALTEADEHGMAFPRQIMSLHLHHTAVIIYVEISKLLGSYFNEISSIKQQVW